MHYWGTCWVLFIDTEHGGLASSVSLIRAFPPQKGDGNTEAVENRKVAKVFSIVIQVDLIAKFVRL